MGRTSIPCSDDTKSVVATRKRDDETWDDCLERLANDTAEASDIDEVLAQLEALEEQLDGLDSTDGSAGAPVNEIREAVRAEVRNQLNDMMAHA